MARRNGWDFEQILRAACENWLDYTQTGEAVTSVLTTKGNVEK